MFLSLYRPYKKLLGAYEAIGYFFFEASSRMRKYKDVVPKSSRR